MSSSITPRGLSGGPEPRATGSDVVAAGAATLPSLAQSMAERRRPMTFRDLHAIRGAPAAANAALAARGGGASWAAVTDSYLEARCISQRDSPALRYAWAAYERACHESDTPVTPVTLQSLTAMWLQRVVGQGRKSSALASYTSRVLTRAKLMGHEVHDRESASIWSALSSFCEDFPCEVSSAAPPLGTADGRLTQVLAFSEQQSGVSLFYLEMHALLHLATVLYPRSSGLLDGHLRLRHLLFQTPSPSRVGGLVVQLVLPKKNKRTVDIRHDSHPVPMGPAVIAVLTLLRALGLLQASASPEAVVFPGIDPTSGRITAPYLSVDHSTLLLRRHTGIFIPSGVAGAQYLTLRSIRYGSSTDAAISGVSEPDRMAQGGWHSQRGANTYVSRSAAILASPPIPNQSPVRAPGRETERVLRGIGPHIAGGGGEMPIAHSQDHRHLPTPPPPYPFINSHPAPPPGPP